MECGQAVVTFKDDLTSARDAIVGTGFKVRSGTVVPVTEDVGYDEAVKLNVTYLYADMVDSSGLVAISPKETVGKVIRLFLDLSVRIIRNGNGHIRSFDGDRVMAIYIGDSKEDRAVKTAMKIKWACDCLIQPKLTEKYKSIRDASWKLKPGIGIATGEALIVRGGVRKSSSDLVSIGVAPNLAAKLSDRRHHPYMIRVGAGTHKNLSRSCLVSGNGTNMWEGPYEMKMGGKGYKYFRTSYRWAIS